MANMPNPINPQWVTNALLALVAYFLVEFDRDVESMFDRVSEHEIRIVVLEQKVVK